MRKVNYKGWQQLQHPFHLFRFPQYRLIWLINTLVNTGQWTFLFASGWEAYAITQSSAWSGAIVFAVFVPSLFGAPFVGAIVDKIDRKQILALSLVLSTLLNAVQAMLSFAGYRSIITLFTIALLYGISLSLQSVTISSLVPGSVPAKQLFNAVYLQSVAQRGAEFIGPALTTPLMITNNPSAVYLFTTIVYFLSLLFSRRFYTTQNTILQEKNDSGFLFMIKKGIYYIAQTKKLRTIISLTSLHCVLTMSYVGLLPIFINKAIKADASFYGTLLSFIGLGAIIGITFLTLWNISDLRNRLLWASAFISALSLVALSVSSGRLAIELSGFSTGLSQGMFMTLAVAMIQEMTEENYRGRVNSVYLLATSGLMSIFNLLYSILGNYFPVRSLFTFMGLTFFLITILFWFHNPFIYIIQDRTDKTPKTRQRKVG